MVPALKPLCLAAFLLILGLLKSEKFHKNNKSNSLFLLDSRFRGNDKTGGFQQSHFLQHLPYISL